MQNRVIPSFTKRGWIRSNIERIDYILAYFFETLPSQSWLNYSGGVSIQELIANNTDNLDNLMNDIQRALEEKLKRYFDNATVVVTYRNPDQVKLTGRAEISVQVSVLENGEQVTIGRDFDQIKSVFRMVVKEVNYGSSE